MRPSFTSLIVLCFATVSLHGQFEQLPNLNIGDPAPPLRVREWLKGSPVHNFEKGQVYIVEFWAVACPPCRSSIPHLSELAEKYKDKVTVIGVDLLSTEFISLEKVKAFVDQMGNQMNYAVAVEDSNFVTSDWLVASDERRHGIPRSFVVDGEGKIAWIGHPMNLDQVLPKIVSKKWNIKKALAQKNLNRYLDSLDTEAHYRLLPYFMASGMEESARRELAFVAIHSILVSEPRLKYAPGMAYRTFVLLLKTDQKKALKYGRKAMKATTYGEPAYFSILDAVTWYSDTLKLSPSICRLAAKACRTYINWIPYPENVEMDKLYTKLAGMYSRGNRRSKAKRAEKKAMELLENRRA